MKTRLLYVIYCVIGFFSLFILPLTIIVWVFTGFSLFCYAVNGLVNLEIDG